MPEIYELTSDAFESARTLFAGIPYDTAFMDAVFEGRQPGRLFVDDPDGPRGALLTRTYDYFLAGEAADSLVQFLVDAPEEAQVFALLYGYVPTSQAWLDSLHTAHRLKLEVIPRRSFRLRTAESRHHQNWRDSVPSQVVVQSIDRELARRVDDELGEMIGLFWGGYDAFVEGGFGKAALIDGNPVSACFANVVSVREYNVSVGTAKQFRREGLAKLVCRSLIAEGASRGLDMTWDCDDANKASAALAMSLGCVEEEPFTEMGYLQRRTPDLTRGLWTSRTTSPSVTTWSRASDTP